MGGIAAARLRRDRAQAGRERDGGRARPADLQALPAPRLGDQAGAGAAARRPHDEILDDAGRQAPAGQADRQGRDLQDPRQPHLPRRGGAQGHELSRRARGDHRSRDLGQGARHPRREYGRSRQRHARADAGVAAGPDLRARRPRDDAVAHAQSTASSTATTSPPTPSARATRNARCAACRRRRSRKRSSRRCGTCCARPRSSRGRGRRRSDEVRDAGARGRQDASPTSRRCGTSFSRPSRRGSSGCWSSGSISSPDGMQVRLRAEGLQTLVEELRSREAKAA